MVRCYESEEGRLVRRTWSRQRRNNVHRGNRNSMRALTLFAMNSLKRALSELLMRDVKPALLFNAIPEGR